MGCEKDRPGAIKLRSLDANGDTPCNCHFSLMDIEPKLLDSNST